MYPKTNKKNKYFHILSLTVIAHDSRHKMHSNRIYTMSMHRYLSIKDVSISGQLSDYYESMTSSFFES